MQGRDSFTPAEAAEIKRLLREKDRADRDTQKRLRSRARTIGFYITDFQTDQSGFTEVDFDGLVQRGTIKIVDPIAAEARPTPDPRGSTNPGLRLSADESSRQRRAEAAAKYRPDRVRVLLVAEAPPAELSRYFYFEDVREHDSLFRYVVRGVLGVEPTRTSKPELLAGLRERGVFLVDLMVDPKTGEDHLAHVDGLVARCRDLRPAAIVLIKAPVYDACHSAMKRAGLPVVDVRVPFPGSGQQTIFERTFPAALSEAARLAGTDAPR